jgi:hypothetical protein
MTTQTISQKAKLNLLFDIYLEYKEGTPPVSMDGKVGEYIGSGEGRVDGPQIRGSVHWTLFEAVNEVACQSNLFGIITTEDGAEIKFDSMGIFMVPDKGKPHLWTTTAGVGFETNDESYRWLNSMLGVWEGDFNMQTHRHHYQAYSRDSA